MSENKYEIRVRERAEEMAKISFPRSKYNSYGNRYTDKENASYWARTIKKLLPAARLSVQREAEAHEIGFRTGVRFANTGKGKKRADDLFEKGYIDKLEYDRCLNQPRFEQSNQSLGLVPENAPGQEAGKV